MAHEYVYGTPGAVAVELKVWHGFYGRVDHYEPDEIQPAVMLEHDRSARPADGMYDMLDEQGEDFTAAFETAAYNPPVEIGVLKWFNRDGVTMTYRFDMEQR